MKRWPIIRHVRWLIMSRKVERHYAMWQETGSLPIYRGLNNKMLDAIWRGER